MSGPGAPDPDRAEPGSMIDAPCGCRAWTQDGVFVIRPCALDCPLFADVRLAAVRHGKPLQNWFGPGRR